MGETKAWRFPVEVDALTGKIQTASVNEDVRQSIYMLLKTIKGERINRPEYGSNLSRFMFEPVNFSLISEMRSEIKTTITENEPRADKLDISVVQSNENPGAVIIRIKYVVRQTGDADEILLEFDAA